MVAVQEYYPKFTPSEYLDWQEKQELRYEYVNGEVYAMTGGTVNHGEIAVNLSTLCRNHLEYSKCRVLSSDVKVSIQESNSYLYPDISITCDDRDRGATNFISHPCLIVEVLSLSTEGYDSSTKTLCERGGKFNLYRRSTSLQEYVLVSTSEVAIDIYRRNERGRWEIISYQAGDTVELESIDLQFPIDRVFKGIVFESSN